MAGVGIHCHNDCELAVVNTLEGVVVGVDMVQGTINGYGERCGNANLVSVVANLVLKLGMDALPKTTLARTTDLSRTVAEIANLALPLQQPFVGYGAFAHKGGQHVSAVLKHRDSYQHIDPGLVGNEPHVLVSELSGRGNVLAKAREFGLELDRDDPHTQWLVQHLKELEHRGYSYEAADASFEMLLRRLQPGYEAPWKVVDFTTLVRKDGGSVHAEATVKVEVDGAVYHTAASGNGPVNALDAALRKALSPKFAGLLKDVETLRRSVIRARDADVHERKTEAIVASWPVERAEEVARAFTVYFHLVNLAEEHHRARVLRERDGRGPQPESLAATVAELQRKHGRSRLMEMLSCLEVHPVFTAHPTEARRRAVVTAIRRVGEQLNRLEDPRSSDADRREAMRRLTEEIDSLWRTGQLRTSQVTPLDEVRSIMAVFDETLFRVVPEIYRSLDWALGPSDAGLRPPLAPAFLRFGSWVGGDRDGNESVTSTVTADTITIQAEHALLAFEAATTRIGRAITVDAATTPPGRDLRRRLAALRAAAPARWAEVEKRSPSEPHRQFLLHIADRVRSTRTGTGEAYRSSSELIADLRCVQASLAGGGAPRQAYGELQHLIWQAETFGLHLAELEVRQHSAVHARALDELRAGQAPSASTRDVLSTLRTIAALQARFGSEVCRRYIVSFTRGVDDIAAVYELAEQAGGKPPVLDVIPLFETVEDLRA